MWPHRGPLPCGKAAAGRRRATLPLSAGASPLLAHRASLLLAPDAPSDNLLVQLNGACAVAAGLQGAVPPREPPPPRVPFVQRDRSPSLQLADHATHGVLMRYVQADAGVAATGAPPRSRPSPMRPAGFRRISPVPALAPPYRAFPPCFGIQAMRCTHSQVM